jgi:5'-3' exonuclease
VKEKFGVAPELIADYLALVGDAADGYPGIRGFGPKKAASYLNGYGPIEKFPPEALGDELQDALLYKRLATLRTDLQLFDDVDDLRWNGPTDSFEALAQRIDPKLLAKLESLQKK